ncbi:MAG: N5-glutamine methyltransferase family protein [Alphaproteobacteria bacterium]
MTRDDVGGRLADAARRLALGGVASPRLDARILLAHVLGETPGAVGLYPERALTDEQIQAFERLLSRRRDREPVSRILGQRGFWTLDLALSPDTLDPRPDTETLIEAVLEACPDRSAPLTMLDLGTGTGCLLLALLSEFPRALGVGVDLSPGALLTARRNAVAAGVADRARWVGSCWAGALTGSFDVIVSNPPYVPDAEIAGLEPEVARFDPRLALSGGGGWPGCLSRPGSRSCPVAGTSGRWLRGSRRGTGLRRHRNSCGCRTESCRHEAGPS